ncbi:DUF1631 family protein [Massilia dura]|uniref:DUF1631 family protein n=1 Tax=Pseudoduganella dura TaxID=321982 RepID=A0A6I3XFK9_9BURK|nr:DUF1631 family protein [Pseudoduganella dura]MUI15734.1 DUF1631 family protein [Pseudoduganella dura]
MLSTSTHPELPPGAVSPRHAVLEELVAIALRHVAEGFGAVCSQLAGILEDGAAPAGARTRAAGLLRGRCHALLPVVSRVLERALREELARLAPRPRGAEQPLELVPYEEMDQRVTFGAIARPFDTAHADALAVLNARLARLLERETLRTNPFRPEVFVAALHQAWTEFDGEPDSAAAVLALLQPDRFHDLGRIYAALDLALERRGVPSGIHRRPWAEQAAHDGRRQAGLSRRLHAYFARTGAEGAPADSDAPPPAGAVGAHLQAWLASLQVRPGDASNVVRLPALRRNAPPGMLSRADEGTIDLLSAVFDTVSGDQAISPESRELLGLLQLPLLKAALADRDFFFQEQHPARRLLELLSHLGWERTLRGGGRRDDPQFQAMRRSVDRAARDGDEAAAAFDQAVRELEAALKAEEAEAAGAIAAPIAAALKQEKTAAARRCARDAVAMRVGTGEVVAVVEAFLENKWTDVLTVAYSIDDDRPGAVRHATQAMDDLLWSVRPKLDAGERRDFIAKLPSLLATLNRWLDVVRWHDADRLRFFAELADCHASIVRAPLDMPAERRLELAVQATRLAAERRAARAAQESRAATVPPAPAPEEELAGLARGTWFDLDGDGGPRKVRLAWISPLRTLFIFSNGAREEAFSLAATELAQRLRAGTATVLHAEGVVVRALSQALAVNDAGATDPAGHAGVAAA